MIIDINEYKKERCDVEFIIIYLICDTDLLYLKAFDYWSYYPCVKYLNTILKTISIDKLFIEYPNYDDIEKRRKKEADEKNEKYVPVQRINIYMLEKMKLKDDDYSD